MREVHSNNINLENEIQKYCKDLSLNYRHNVTSTNSKDGYHRYVILNPSISTSKSKSISSKNCIYYTQARFSKYRKPSIIQEKSALQSIVDYLKNYKKITLKKEEV